MPPKWPHDHSAKHAAAARLGWQHRRERLQEPVKTTKATKTKGAKKVEKPSAKPAKAATQRIPSERSIANQKAKIAALERENAEIEKQHYETRQNSQAHSDAYARLIFNGTALRLEIQERKQKLARDERKHAAQQPAHTASNEKKRAKVISLENQQRALRAEIAELQKQYVRDLRPDGEHRAASVAIHTIGPQLQRKMRQLEAVQTRLRKARG